MKLSDVMSAADLAIYAEVGLVLFLIAFSAVVLNVTLKKKGSYDEVARIPLEEAPVQPRRSSLLVAAQESHK